MTNFRLHTPEELQKIAEEDFDQFKEDIGNYYNNHWEYYLDNVVPVLLNVSKLNDFSIIFVISELNKIGENDYSKLQLIAKKIYEIDYEFYVNNTREILDKYNPQSKHFKKKIASLTESDNKPRKYNNYYAILIVFMILVVISLAIYKYFYDIKILNEEIIKKDIEINQKELEKQNVQNKLDSINKEFKVIEGNLARLKKYEIDNLSAQFKHEQDIIEEKNREENRLKQVFDDLDPLEKEIIQASKKMRQVTKKEQELSYEIKYKTIGADIQRKSLKYKKFAKEEFAPAAERFSNLLTLYNDKHGGSSVRDLAVKWEFLDLLR